MKQTIYNINITLKMFILSICLLNVTACSATVNTRDTTEETRTIGHLDSNIDANTNIASKSSSKRTTSHSEVETKDSSKSLDSTKTTTVRNNKAVKKRELIIDSIISIEGKIFGLRACERSSDAGNEDSETKWYGFVDSDKTSNDKGGTSNEMLSTDFTRIDQAKARLAESEDSFYSSRARLSTRTEGWFLFVITELISSWWFWIVVILIAFFTWCYLRKINPIMVIKTLFNKFQISGNNTSQ